MQASAAEPTGHARQPARWDIREAAWVVCIYSGFSALFFNVPALLRLAGHLAGWLRLPGLAGSFDALAGAYPAALQALAPALAGALAAWLASRTLRVPLAEFGVRKPVASVKWLVLFSGLLCVLYGGGTALLLLLARPLAMRLAPTWAIAEFGLGWALILYCLAAPLGEELVFRGILYPPLRERIGAPLGILVSAIVFALMHNLLSLSLSPPLTQFAGGLVMAYAYEKSGALLYPVVYHACGNGLLFAGYLLCR